MQMKLISSGEHKSDFSEREKQGKVEGNESEGNFLRQERRRRTRRSHSKGSVSAWTRYTTVSETPFVSSSYSCLSFFIFLVPPPIKFFTPVLLIPYCFTSHGCTKISLIHTVPQRTPDRTCGCAEKTPSAL